MAPRPDHGRRSRRILAIDPCNAGIAFVVLEGDAFLVDWGVARVWSKALPAVVARVEQLVERYQPALLVLEDPGCTARRGRYRRLAPAVWRSAESAGLPVAYVALSDVAAMFPPGASTKMERAEALVEVFPELQEILPPPRKPWMGEDARINIFDALGWAMVTSRR